MCFFLIQAVTTTVRQQIVPSLTSVLRCRHFLIICSNSESFAQRDDVSQKYHICRCAAMCFIIIFFHSFWKSNTQMTSQRWRSASPAPWSLDLTTVKLLSGTTILSMCPKGWHKGADRRRWARKDPSPKRYESQKKDVSSKAYCL